MCVYELELFSKLNQHSKDTLQRHEITHQLYFDILRVQKDAFKICLFTQKNKTRDPKYFIAGSIEKAVER